MAAADAGAAGIAAATDAPASAPPSSGSRPLSRLYRFTVGFTIGSQPVTNPCMAMPTTFEITQYSAKPLGKLSVKKPNIAGIIQSIMRLVDAWRSSAVGIVVIFCITNMDAPTRTGMTNGDGSATAKSIHRKRLSSGITLWTCGSQS